jgi:hypothetical protein
VPSKDKALAVAKRDAMLVHKFLRLAALKTGANKKLLAVAEKQDDALQQGLKAAMH